MDKDLQRNIILEHYQNPLHRGRTNDNSYQKINNNNVSCIDNIDVYVKVENDIIEDILFDGEACVISISSTSIMTDLLIGKTISEALNIIDNYKKMINEEEYDKEVLKEALVYSDVSKQPSRINCATLSILGIEKILKEKVNK